MWFFDGFEPAFPGSGGTMDEFSTSALEPRLINSLSLHHLPPTFVNDALDENGAPFELTHGNGRTPSSGIDGNTELMLATTESEEPIVVVGHLLSYEAGGGGGGSGLGDPKDPYKKPGDPGEDYTLNQNTDFFIPNDDALCQDGAAVNASEAIEGLLGTEGNFEFVGLLVENSDGTFGLSQNEVSTLYDTLNSSFDALSDYSSAYGVVHNHAYDQSISGNRTNYLNRYPSTGDWQSLDILVAKGADPSHLSVFILDPFGALREFQYSDRALYESMDDQQRLDGDNLPAETQGCSGG